jgi:hypothetical protein
MIFDANRDRGESRPLQRTSIARDLSGLERFSDMPRRDGPALN